MLTPSGPTVVSCPVFGEVGANGKVTEAFGGPVSPRELEQALQPLVGQ